MRSTPYLGLLAILLGGILAAACAPAGYPPTAAPAATPAAPSPPVSTPPAPSARPQDAALRQPQDAALRQPQDAALRQPQDAAWQSVVDAARREGKLTVYSFSFTGDLGIALARAFKERYGIQMDIVSGSGAVFLERLKMEARAGQRVADVLEGSATNGILAKKDGLTQSFGSLPAIAETGIWLFDPRIDPENHIVGYSPSISSPWANTALVKPADEPKSWRDLLAPRWKGKMVVTEPDTMPLPTVYYIALRRYMGLDDEFFRALGRQDLIITANQRENDSKLVRGEAPLSLTSNLTSMSNLVAEGAPAKPLDMKEGVPGRTQTLNVVKDATHPNAARVFINWLLSAEGQTVGARIRNTLPLRTDVPDFTPAPARVKYTKVFAMTPKDEDENTQALRDRAVSKLWGR
ncbi:MAG: extracellular solute-binding protein [Chloroflexi bacterium]|nr:extracellular solute-binding protein [Chloroflexota bacterium]